MEGLNAIRRAPVSSVPPARVARDSGLRSYLMAGKGDRLRYRPITGQGETAFIYFSQKGKQVGTTQITPEGTFEMKLDRDFILDDPVRIEIGD